MLVLSRKLNQSIVLGDNIKIEVLKISGNTVRIGVQAPDDVKILRGELAPYGVTSEPTQQPAPPQAPTMIELDLEFGMDQDDLTRLPNPFAVAHAG